MSVIPLNQDRQPVVKGSRMSPSVDDGGTDGNQLGPSRSQGKLHDSPSMSRNASVEEMKHNGSGHVSSADISLHGSDESQKSGTITEEGYIPTRIVLDLVGQYDVKLDAFRKKYEAFIQSYEDRQREEDEHFMKFYGSYINDLKNKARVRLGYHKVLLIQANREITELKRSSSRSVESYTSQYQEVLDKIKEDADEFKRNWNEQKVRLETELIKEKQANDADIASYIAAKDDEILHLNETLRLLKDELDNHKKHIEELQSQMMSMTLASGFLRKLKSPKARRSPRHDQGEAERKKKERDERVKKIEQSLEMFQACQKQLGPKLKVKGAKAECIDPYKHTITDVVALFPEDDEDCRELRMIVESVTAYDDAGYKQLTSATTAVLKRWIKFVNESRTDEEDSATPKIREEDVIAQEEPDSETSSDLEKTMLLEQIHSPRIATADQEAQTDHVDFVREPTEEEILAKKQKEHQYQQENDELSALKKKSAKHQDYCTELDMKLIEKSKQIVALETKLNKLRPQAAADGERNEKMLQEQGKLIAQMTKRVEELEQQLNLANEELEAKTAEYNDELAKKKVDPARYEELGKSYEAAKKQLMQEKKKGQKAMTDIEKLRSQVERSAETTEKEKERTKQSLIKLETQVRAECEEVHKKIHMHIDTLKTENSQLLNDNDKQDETIDQLEKRKLALQAELEELNALSRDLDALRVKCAEGEKAQEDLLRAKQEVARLDELYRAQAKLRVKLHNQLEDLKVRFKPLIKIEEGQEVIVGFPDDASLKLKCEGKFKEFNFDRVYPIGSTQEQVFEDCETLITSVMDGFNVCIFAYGQTGAGKTYTMLGKKGQEGLSPRAVNLLFKLIADQAETHTVQVQTYMVEIYLGKIVDLLWQHENNPKRSARVDAPKVEIRMAKDRVQLLNVLMKDVHSAEEMMSIFNIAQSARHVTSTKMNDESSRSHFVLGIYVTSTNNVTGRTNFGKLSLIDLAGSEDARRSGATGEAFEQMKAINQSLSQLSNVITALVNGDPHIPYRESQLTQLMADSLGGDAKTLMFVNISPAESNLTETTAALTYAKRVKLVKNNAKKEQESAGLLRIKARNAELVNIIGQLRSGVDVDIGEALSDDLPDAPREADYPPETKE